MKWTNWRWSNYWFFYKWLWARVTTQTLVDLGAGERLFGGLFDNFKYIGVDFKAFPGVGVITDLTKDLPLQNETADIVTLSNTVEHIPNTAHLFSEVFRILKKDGLVLGTIPFLLPVHQAPYDFNRYTHFHLQKLLEDAGFQNVSVEALGEQTDAYNTIERKTFDELYKSKPSILLTLVRNWRRAEMKVIQWLFPIPATSKVCEGYGFAGYKL